MNIFHNHDYIQIPNFTNINLPDCLVFSQKKNFLAKKRIFLSISKLLILNVNLFILKNYLILMLMQLRIIIIYVTFLTFLY